MLLHCDNCGFGWSEQVAIVNHDVCPECGGQIVDGPGEDEDEDNDDRIAFDETVFPDFEPE
jgi:hypothetical protein